MTGSPQVEAVDEQVDDLVASADSSSPRGSEHAWVHEPGRHGAVTSVDWGLVPRLGESISDPGASFSSQLQFGIFGPSGVPADFFKR